LSDREYEVNRKGARGGDGQTQINFFVSPRLPENMSDISFVLIPYASPLEKPNKEVVLDQEVHF
jgi:hypothetical protein